MTNLTPAELNAGVATDTSVVHSSQDDEETGSRKHPERDISRLQSTVLQYLTDRTYNIGDLVLQNDVQYRCISIVGDEAFDPTKWMISDGIGAKNVVQVFTPDDFGPLESGFYQLSQETEYVICAEIDLGGNGLELPDTAIVTFRTFNKEVNKIESTSNPILIGPIGPSSISGSYSSVTNIGNGIMRFEISVASSALNINSRVNIEGTAYKLTNQSLVGFVNDTSFDIRTFDEGDESGGFSNKPVKVEMSEVEFEGSGTNGGLSLDFTPVGSSEFYAHHCDFEKLSFPIIVNGVKLAITTLCEFEESGTSLYRETTQNIIHTENSYFEPNSGNFSNLQILNLTDAINAVISNNSFESNGTVNAINIRKSNDVVKSVTVTNRGSGYTTEPSVTIAAPISGTQATADANVIDGEVDSVTVTNEGSGYVSAPNVTFGGPGTLADADANLGTNFPPDTRYLLTGNLDKNPTSTSLLSTVDSGQDETNPNIIVRANGRQKDSKAFSDNNIQGDPDNIFVVPISASDQFVDIVAVNGISSTTVTAGGMGYPINPTVTIAAPVSGTQAMAIGFAPGGIVTRIFIVDGGSGYTTEPSVTIDGGDMMATADANLAALSNWTTNAERFSQTNVTNGEVTYTGLEDTVISIAYDGEYQTIDPDNTCLAVFVDSGGGFAIVPDSQTYVQTAGAAIFNNTTRTKVLTVSNGDKIKLRVSNFDGTADVKFLRTSMEISEV